MMPPNDEPVALPLYGYVIAPDVGRHKCQLPVGYFDFNGRVQFPADESGIIEACDKMRQLGLRPRVIVPDGASEYVFCVPTNLDCGETYLPLDEQEEEISYLLSEPDPEAVHCWNAMAEGESSQNDELRWGTENSDFLVKYGEALRLWQSDIYEEDCPLMALSRDMSSREFILVESNESGYMFAHCTAPFAMLRLNPECNQVYAAGAFAVVPRGITAEELSKRLPEKHEERPADRITIFALVKTFLDDLSSVTLEFSGSILPVELPVTQSTSSLNDTRDLQGNKFEADDPPPVTITYFTEGIYFLMPSPEMHSNIIEHRNLIEDLSAYLINAGHNKPESLSTNVTYNETAEMFQISIEPSLRSPATEFRLVYSEAEGYSLLLFQTPDRTDD